VKAYLSIGMVMAAGLHAQAQDCTVTVHENHNGEMPLALLFNARMTATQVFREIGVNLRIVNGYPSHDLGDACGAPIVIEFEKAGNYHGSAEAMAYAAPYKNSGTSIHVFIDRVLRYVNGKYDFKNPLLAYVMVHEITHVLEGVVRHSDEGVMKASWSNRDYERMKRHALPFAPEDVDLIRSALAKRISYAAAGE
jgi:hypothetical protein